MWLELSFSQNSTRKLNGVPSPRTPFPSYNSFSLSQIQIAMHCLAPLWIHALNPPRPIPMVAYSSHLPLLWQTNCFSILYFHAVSQSVLRFLFAFHPPQGYPISASSLTFLRACVKLPLSLRLCKEYMFSLSLQPMCLSCTNQCVKTCWTCSSVFTSIAGNGLLARTLYFN